MAAPSSSSRMYNKKDHYHRKANQEGYLARSAYKLKEIQAKYKLIKKNAKVLELGCSPGAWSQVALEILGENGRIVGIDLEPAALSDARLDFVLGDIFSVDAARLPGAPFDCVLSDMAPKTSGIKVRDQSRSYELAEYAVKLCDEMLVPRGNLLLKIFEGPDLQKLAQEIRARFTKVERIRPESTRQASTEIYFLGLNKK